MNTSLPAQLLRLIFLCLLSLLAACSTLPRPGAALPAPFVQALDKSGIGKDAVALVVQPVDSPGDAIEYQSHLPLQPASIMKLVTSEAALSLLGPDHHWMTRVHATGSISGDVLNGDLIIEGGGDPRLAHEDLMRMLRALRQLGVREIRGDLVLDRSLFQPALADAAAFDGQPARAYNAQPDALLLDAKALNVRLLPDGDRVQVFSEPPLEGFDIKPPQLAHGSCGRLREQLQPELSAQGLRFAGSYPRECGERELAFHLHTLDAVQYFSAVFRPLWRELGGSLSGQVRDGRGGDIAAPAVLQRHGNAHAHAKVARLFGFRETAEVADL